MRSFLVEVYAAPADARELTAAAGRARTLEASRGVRYWGSLVLPEDEVCFHIFEAPSERALVQASEGAELGHDRIVEAIWMPRAGA